ncbi:MAG: hypothetical protein L3J37_06505 [Rhodobacteraceae bacterium]|nr:hypothetical protein [Paracoccaceae bacterium]
MKKVAYAAAALLFVAACDVSDLDVGGGGIGLNHVMTINNNTGVTMTQFYASNSGQRYWGPDQLGATVMYSGSGRLINFEDGTGACLYDFKAVFADGDQLITTNRNVCVESNWSYN